MDKYINAEEVLEIAVRIEENGKLFYESAYERAEAPGIKKQLNALASWEDGHIAKMQELLSKYSNDDDQFPLYLSPEEDTSLYLKELADQHIFVRNSDIEEMIKSCRTVTELLEMARKFEQDSVNFYSSLAEKVVDTETKSVLLTIAEEERTHVSQVDKMISLGK